MTEGDFRPPPGTGWQPAPMNRPPTQPLTVGVQPGTPNIIRAFQVIIAGGANSGLFVYSPTVGFGNLIASIAATSGTDPYGNVYVGGGLASYGGGFTNYLGLVGGVPELQFKTGLANEMIAGNIAGGVVGVGPAETMQLLMSGPEGGTVGGRDWVQVYMTSNNTGLTSPAQGQLRAISDTAVVSEALTWDGNGAGIPNRASVPASLAGSQQVYGWNGQLKYVSSDANAYNTGHLLNTMTVTQLVNSTTPANLTPLVAQVSSLASYRVSGLIVVQQGTVAANQAIRITGPAINFAAVSVLCVEGSAIFNSGVSTALGTDMTTGSVPASTTGELHFDGIVSPSANGTLQVVARCVTSGADTWTVGVGSFFKVEPMT